MGVGVVTSLTTSGGIVTAKSGVAAVAHALIIADTTNGVAMMTAGTNGQIVVGKTSNDPLFATMSGDATIDNTGAVTLANTVIRTSGANAFAADQSMGSHKLTNLSNGTASTDAATYGQLTTLINGATWKAPVKVLAHSNITLSGEQTIDGVLTSASRVGVVGQSTVTQNGIYTTASGSWVRTADLAAGASAAGIAFFVEDQGTTYKNTQWICTADPGSDVVGTNNLTFAQFGAGTSYAADESTLHLSGTTFSIISTYTGQTSIVTLGTIATGVWQGTVVGSTYGGTGVNNAGRTLTIAANSGTISFTSSVTLTVAAAASVSGINSGDQTVTGTANRISVSGGGGATPTVDISASYVGQSSITTLGTLTGLTEIVSDAATNATSTGATFGHDTSGTAAAGFGSVYKFQLQDSTTADTDAFNFTLTWATATHASRKARGVFNVFDTATREALRMEASGTAAMIGFLGATASAALASPDLGTLATTFGLATGTPTFAGANVTGTVPAATTAGTCTGLAGSATILATARNLWGQSFDGSAAVTGSLTAVGDITGGASSMTLTAGTGNSRTLTLRSTTSGGTATAFLTGNADQSSTFGGNISGTGAWTMTGGAGNMTIVSGTGNSRTMILQTTTSGGTATTALTLAADQSATFANTVNATTFVGALTGNASGSSGSCTGNAATATALQTGRAINGTTFDGTAAITVTAAAGTLTGTTLNATVVTSSLTSVGTLTGGATGAGFTVALTTSTVTGTLPAGAFPALTGDVTTAAGALATTIAKISSTGLLTGYVYGFQLNYTSTSTLVIASGKCRDSTDTANINLTTALTTLTPTTNTGAITGIDRKALTGTVATVSTSAVTGTSSHFLTDFGTKTGSGTIAGVSTTITGTTTKFLSEVAVGDLIGTNAKGYSLVTAIASDTSLTIAIAIPGGDPTGTAPVIIENCWIQVNAQVVRQVQKITSDTALTMNTASVVTESGVTGYAGALPALATYLMVFVATGGSGTGVYLSTQRTTPFGITGYTTNFRRVGSFCWNATLVLPFDQIGINNQRRYQFEAAGVRILSAGTSQTWATVVANGTGMIPPTAVSLLNNMLLSATAGNNVFSLRKRGLVTGDGTAARPATNETNQTTTLLEYQPTWCACDGAQGIEYILSAAGGTCYLDLGGYEEYLL